jgi:hypothetical protein
LVRRSAKAPRLALEIDDIGIAAHDQNLAEMEVAMDARHQGAFAARRHFVHGREEIGAAFVQHFGACAIVWPLPFDLGDDARA